MQTRTLLLMFFCAACDGEPAALYGEVHVHGFAGGSHPGALFVASAVPASQASGDSILAEPPALATAGDCELAGPAAVGGAATQPIDGGLVRISGGRGIGEVELAFTSRGYLPSAPLSGPLFVGGERLALSGAGAIAPAFTGELEAPRTLILLQPAAPALPDGDFVVAWVPDRATRIALTLVVSRSDGASAIVTCVADDAAGQVIVPARLLSFLPARPRDVQLIVSRDQLAAAPSGRAGLGVKMHAGFETRLDWHEGAP